MMHKNKADKWHVKEKNWRDNCFPEDWPIITKADRMEIEQTECVCLGENNETKPYKCPVCGGRGIVPHGFYNVYVDSINSVTSTLPETCRACNGNGIIMTIKNYEIH